MGKVFPSRVHRRNLAYAALVVGVLVVRIPMGRTDWVREDRVYVVLESIATLLSLAVGVTALVRYYSRRSAAFLILGSGFLIAGLLDGYYLLKSSTEGAPPAGAVQLSASAALNLYAAVFTILGYTIILAALFRGISSVFSQGTLAIGNLQCANESLAREIEARQRAELALQKSRDELEERVTSRTAGLAEQGALSALASEIAVLLTQNEPVNQVLQRSAELMVLFLDAGFVRIWTVNRDDNVLELQASAGQYTQLNGPYARVPIGQLKIGWIAQESKPYLTNNFQDDPGICESDRARREGIVGFAGYPLTIGDEVVGVIAAFAKRPFSKSAYQTFGSLAGNISQFIGRKRVEAALQDSEERVRLLLDSTAEAIYGIDLNGNCTFANRACVQLLGAASAEEMLGKNMHQVMHHSRSDGTPLPVSECRIYQGFLRGEGSHVDDEVLWRAHGSCFPAEYWSYPIRKEGKVVGAVVTFLDITERKLAEEEQRKLVALIETSTDFIVMASPEGKVFYLNQGGAKMIGLDSPNQALGRHVSELHPESAWNAIASQIPVAMKTGQVLLETQLHNCRTGRAIDVLMNGFLVKKPESGDVLCLGAVMRDITERKRAEDRLRNSEERFRIASENASDITFEWDLHTDQFEVFGLTDGRLGYRQAARSLEEWKSIVHPDDREPVLTAINRHIETGKRYTGEYRVPEEDGCMRYYSVHGQSIRDPGGEPRKFIGVVSDITEQKRTEEAISRLAAIVQSSEDAIIGTDLSGIITTWNGGAERLLGHSASEAMGGLLSMLLPKSGQVSDILDSGSHGAVSRLDETSFVCKGGSQVPVSVTVSPIRKTSGEISGVAIIARDISARKKAENALAHQALHDHLTGLPNPLLLADRLTSSIHRCSQSDLMTAVIYVDLDGFKFVNDTLGHEAGDLLLKEVTVRLQECVRELDTLARMGGDEFMVVVSEIKHDSVAHDVAERLREALHRPFKIADRELCITASVGISVYPRDGEDVSALRRNADAAMYEAKRNGKDRVLFFSPAMRDTFLEHLELETELRHALDREDELALVYQPILEADSCRQIAFEALLRWSHPVLGSISPAKFVAVAEETGLIFRLGAWVLKQACLQCRLWQEHGFPGVRVAANVSALEFARPEFAENVLRVLENTGLPGHLLDLEVTETVLMRDMDEAIKKMSVLRARGVRISIDDFGTGYSSLGYLPRLPIDTLKIDRSFVHDVGKNGTARSLIAGIISLAHSIGKQVVVEGVETLEQMEILKGMACDEVQGFLLGRPAPLPDWGQRDILEAGSPSGTALEPSLTG
jgi:diguanylate cyclase (GGDEF)-like protein/PAS domain S-box-containing protein